MQPSILTLDRGNSTLDAMLHGSHPRRERLRVADADHLLRFLGEDRPVECIGVTVVPGALDGIAQALRARGFELRLAGRDLPCPLRIDYDTPHTLGADRWLGALAAHRQFGCAITVDCGSATTINLVEADGVFRGGAIAPGLSALLDGMAQRTPGLPTADPAAAPVSLPARSSAASVAAGVVRTFCGGIERMVADLIPAAHSTPRLVVTGGHADVYRRHGQLAMDHMPDLVHRGLLALASRACGC